MRSEGWYLLIGAVLLAVTFVGTRLKRLPLSTSLLYLCLGFVLGKTGIAEVHEQEHPVLLERLSEFAVILSLFTAGLKLKPELNWERWQVPLRLAFVAMLFTVAGIALTGMLGLGLSLGAAVLFGAILAPTDPVLASDVRVVRAGDNDRIRFGLTGEAGFNDGTAFPFVLLGLGLLGLRPLGPFGLHWLLVDVLWATVGGLVIGFLLGSGVGRTVVYLRTHHKEALGLDELLALGLIAVAYGSAVMLNAFGFLSVFAAGLAVRRIETRATGSKPAPEVSCVASVGQLEEIASNPERAPAYMAEAVLAFNEQLERIAELALVLVLGVLLSQADVPWARAAWFVPLMLFVLRPIAVYLGLIGSRTSSLERAYLSWFGIRGIGSIYYLFYARNHGLSELTTGRINGLVLATITASIVLHGISVTPLMQRYSQRKASRLRDVLRPLPT